MIRIRDLRVDYDNICAVDDLTLSVEPGEVCGLIGPNGAGKTTTMKALLGLIEPTYGEIEVMGVDMRERPEDVYRVMGFMPDFPPVYEDLLVWDSSTACSSLCAGACIETFWRELISRTRRRP
jgi:ABC-2 type transport system ATP-binding protein